jgi:hypothetical protein
MYNFILLLLNIQCRDTNVHAGWLLETESSAYEGEEASEGVITQTFSSDSKTDPNKMAKHCILRSTNLLIVRRIGKN